MLFNFFIDVIDFYVVATCIPDFFVVELVLPELHMSRLIIFRLDAGHYLVVRVLHKCIAVLVLFNPCLACASVVKCTIQILIAKGELYCKEMLDIFCYINLQISIQ